MAAPGMTQFGTWQPKIRGRLFYNWPCGTCEEALRFISPVQLGSKPYDVAIVGAGVVGCALAYRLSMYDLRVLLVERLHDVGEGTSKANSALIHTGYDAKPGTLESELLREAAAYWPDLAARLKIPLDPIGGIMMAVTDEQERQLEVAKKNAYANRATDVSILSAAEVREREPNASSDVCGGLLVPRESMIDPFMASIAYAEVALVNGIDLLLGVDIAGVELGQALHHLITADGHRLPACRIVNAAGLGSRRLADGYGGGAFDINPRRGQFVLFDQSARSLVRHILLPVPTVNTKGVLVSPTIFGNLLVGPTAEDLPLDDPEAAHTTLEGIRRVIEGGSCLVSGLTEQPVVATYAGARCACNQGSYVIRYNDGAPGLVTLTGVRSTGLTASISLARHLIDGMQKELGLELSPDIEALDTRPESAWPGWWRRPFANDTVDARVDHGCVVCFCEVISEGEIRDALDSPLKPRTMDALKRRTRSMMGRCQGFDCQVPLAEIMSSHTGITISQLTKNGPGSELVAPSQRAFTA
ncbi:MAG: NAD(P)/FAD-dependent oxidoreductase [Verrucomicrobiota bacterium]|nr:NAD(P)/FAD-dependent oxidoreductase [Verrucomicrobiota bacterium]MDP7048039.1 NAD(P)/FAD-dependent oxidoreductase [Verrucomicrobiota bacterium]